VLSELFKSRQYLDGTACYEEVDRIIVATYDKRSAFCPSGCGRKHRVNTFASTHAFAQRASYKLHKITEVRYD